MRTIDACKNMCGDHISPKLRDKIKLYLNNPSNDLWDEIKSIIIAPLGKTIWQAIIQLDPSFPNTGRIEDMNGHIVEEWERIPLPLEVLRAIKNTIEA